MNTDGCAPLQQRYGALDRTDYSVWDSPIDGPTLYAPYDGYLKERPGVWVGRELADAVIQRAITGEGSSTGYRLTGQPEVRALFVGNNPRLIELVQEAVVRWDLERTIAVPPYLFGPEPPCDTAPYFTAGIPSLCHITGPLYLFDHHDTIDKVRAEDLPRVAGFVDQLICNLDCVPADVLEIGLARHRDDPPAPSPPWFLPPEV